MKENNSLLVLLSVLLNLIGLIHGIIFGIILLIRNYIKLNKSIFLLSIFILIYSLELLVPIRNIGLKDKDLDLSSLVALLSVLALLLFPLFYLYVKQISILAKSKIDYKIVIPVLFIFVFNVIYIYIGYDIYILKVICDILNVLGTLYGLIIGFATIRLLKKHVAELYNQYTAIEYKKLQWAKTYIVLGLCYVTLGIALKLLFPLIIQNHYYQFVMTIINIGLLYWVSIHGVFQQNIIWLLADKSKVLTTKQTKPTTVEPKIEEDLRSINILLKELESFMIQEKGYTKTDLTIIDAAERLGIHPKQLSKIINSKYNQNFNTYINTHRVKKVIEVLESDSLKNLSIEGIAIEVGFQSKSAFYGFFKKYTGTTPLKYKKSLKSIKK
ncbi:AraC family transcriptional regulator [Aquimarina sp. Aq78]|uniref:helix-turn-helix domain-containing protein n=1 Tax=Aquimarina sp. Aq78 TaxID=1191889 RepID=UPI000D10F99E|nr:helix-turn-helix domain-containing protein [Aquimarina sp. Aq78]